jgi:hypothetical protein
MERRKKDDCGQSLGSGIGDSDHVQVRDTDPTTSLGGERGNGLICRSYLFFEFLLCEGESDESGEDTIFRHPSGLQT